MTVYSILKKKALRVRRRRRAARRAVPASAGVAPEQSNPAARRPSDRAPAGRNGGDPLAKDTLDAVRHAEQEAEKILENAAHRSAAIRQSAENKAAELRAQRLQQAEEKRGRLLADAQADADDYTRRAQEETAALAQQLRQKAEENGPKTIRAILDRITG